MKDLRMNSESLQARHRQVYESFYVQHDLVLSAPQIVNWGYTAATEHNTILQIKQKLPTKMYLGVSLVAEPGLHFDDMTIYNFQKDAFDHAPLHQVYQGEVHKRLLETIQHRIQSSKMGGVKISFLSEFARGDGSGFSGTLTILIALLIFVYTQDVDPEFLSKQELHAIRELALKIDTRIFNMKRHVGGLLPYSTLCDSDFITAYFGDPIFDHERFQLSPFDYQDRIIDMKKYAYTDDLARIGFEYVVVDTGQPYAARYKKTPQKQVIGDISAEQKSLEVLRNDLEDFDIALKESSVDSFYHKASLRNMISYVQNPSDKILEKMIGTFKKLERDNDMYTACNQAFNLLKERESDIVAFVPVAPCMGNGRFLCIAKEGVLKKIIDPFVEKLESIMGSPFRVAHSLWRDGGSYGGGKIEQFLSEGKYSTYIRKGTVIYSDIHGNKKIITMDEVMKLTTNGFLLDGVSKKIYYDGKKLTSKDIVSQSTTVDVLLMLFDNVDKDISNESLERSSYSRNKNEMLSKVVLPFKKFVKSKTQKILPLECTGGLYQYMIRLGETDIPFHRVNKIGEGILIQ